MKLLIVTQIVDKNDPILGFFHRWLLEFARHVEQLTVICLKKGEYALPDNVKVLSLGKEEGKGRLVRLWRFYKYIWGERKNYDVVFVHMNPIYVLLAWDSWKLMGKKIALWYTHKQVDLKLRIAAMFSDIIFTASKESFRLPSKKLQVMGHGVDVEQFALRKNHRRVKMLRVVTVGRLSPVKGYDILLDAIKALRDHKKQMHLNVIGGPNTPEDEQYAERLVEKVQKTGLEKQVTFHGPGTHDTIAEHLTKADVFVNMSGTGSLDKAILEAMAVGVPVVTSNDAGKAIIQDVDPALCMHGRAVDGLVNALEHVRGLKTAEYKALGDKLSARVHESHSLQKLIEKLVLTMQ